MLNTSPVFKMISRYIASTCFVLVYGDYLNLFSLQSSDIIVGHLAQVLKDTVMFEEQYCEEKWC